MSIQKKMISVMIAMMIFVSLEYGSNAFAEGWSEFVTVEVPEELYYVYGSSIARTGARNDIAIDLYSVYPTDDSKDNFTRARFAIYARDPSIFYSVRVSSPTTISETEGIKYIEIIDGYLHYIEPYVMVSGNDPDYAAYVQYKTNGY